MAEAPANATALPSPSAGNTLAARGLDVEAARMNSLREAMVKRRTEMIRERQPEEQWKPQSMKEWMEGPAPGYEAAAKARKMFAGLQGAMLEGFIGGLPTVMGAEGEGVVSEGDELMAQGAQMAREAAQAERLQSLKAAAAAKKEQLLQSKEGEEAKKKIQQEFRKAAKSAIRRGVEYLINFVAGSVDTGTMGVSTIVDILIYAFTLVDLNIQMIWGYYISKKKSVLFPALEWSPLPIPLPDIILHAGLVLFDLLIILLVTVITLTALILFLFPYIAPIVGPIVGLSLFSQWLSTYPSPF